jgi:serine/threonine protein kinase
MGAFVSVTGVVMVLMLCAHHTKEPAADFLESVPSLPPRFSYSKLQKATKNFGRKLGDGAFGSVYEGSLPNGSRVAVKVLEKASVQGEKQFRAEVASMGAIRHLNLVRLHGFCSEGSHRLLVYEFMANGSLDSWLFKRKQGEKQLDWEQRLNIALGTARALSYLHEECSDHIIHLDVKPENILLDHQLCPKLSDFGLAKLMDREQSRVVTSMRGTPGYLAPEWLLPHAAVTAKTDVYSFGMVLLELISGRENTNFSLGKEQWYFPAWAYKLMGEGRTMELLDKRLHVEEVEYFHKKDAVRAIHIALLCIQDDPALRPPMSRVVHMLQGHVEPEALNANQSAIQPPRRLISAFAASMSDIDASATQQVEAFGPAINSRVPIESQVMESPKVMESPRARESAKVTESPRVVESPQVLESPRISIKVLPPVALEETEEPPAASAINRPEPLLSPAVYISKHVSRQQRIPGAHSIGLNPKYIPPWPVKGDVVLLRGKGGDFVGVVRDVRVQTKKMQIALIHRLSSEGRFSVREEETIWRDWNEAVKTLDFWVILRWSTVPERGAEKFPVEWMVR